MNSGAPAAVSDAPFALAQDLDTAALAEAFAERGRLHIPGIFEPSAAARLHAALAAETDWACATLVGGRGVDTPLKEIDAWSQDRRNLFVLTADREAARGFHFMFDTVRLTSLMKAGRRVAPVYRELCAYLSGPEFLGFIHALTGDDRARHADAQATRFRPGHYLNVHDDNHPDLGRLYAYVLNLTPGWRADFGGLLTFLDPAGHVSEAFTPTFNALNIFRVPHQHAVTPIALFAPARGRLSITGWLRQDEPPVFP
jgi:SM-20-related protein